MKIFGIGLNKTGLTTLTRALIILGYRGAQHPSPTKYANIRHDDFIVDMPVPYRYRELDVRFPGSKFILTVRTDLEEWWASAENQHRKEEDAGYELPGWHFEYRMQSYGTIDFDKELHTLFYARHHAEVLSYFRHRMSDLLVLDFFSGDGWEPLCKFLGKPVPDERFPHLNKRR